MTPAGMKAAIDAAMPEYSFSIGAIEGTIFTALEDNFGLSAGQFIQADGVLTRTSDGVKYIVGALYKVNSTNYWVRTEAATAPSILHGQTFTIHSGSSARISGTFTGTVRVYGSAL